MKFPHSIPVKEIAAMIGAKVVGDENAPVSGINEIHRTQEGDLAFVDHPKYYEKCLRSAASFIIIDREVEERFGKTLLLCAQPFEAYQAIVKRFRPFHAAEQMISPGAIVGKGTVIMPGVFIGDDVIIGSNCIIHPNVSICDHCIIGDNVIIHPGAILGADAFYFNGKKNRPVWFRKMLSCGRVVIEDEVEIGANTCIDRGVTSDTRVGRGTKIDNLVQVGHDVVIGMNCIIAAQVGIAGATTIGNGVSLWGQVGVNKTLSIGDNAQVYAQSGVAASLDADKTYFGSPAEDASIRKREMVWMKRIPELWKRVRSLEEKDNNA